MNKKHIYLFICICGISSLYPIYELQDNEKTSIDLCKLKINTLLLKNTTVNDLILSIDLFIPHSLNTFKTSPDIIKIPAHQNFFYNISATKDNDKNHDKAFIKTITNNTSEALFTITEHENASYTIQCNTRNNDHGLSAVGIEAIDFNKDLVTNTGIRSLKFIIKSSSFSKHVLAPLKPENILRRFKSMYKQNRLDNLQPHIAPIIPKIIHHIWLGSPFPDGYKSWRQSWINKHPQWTYVFWTDNPENYQEGTLVDNETILKELLDSGASIGKTLVIDVRNVTLTNRSLYDSETNYGEKSDILRYEILYRYGGVYTDTDVECFEPFDILHHTYKFYAGLAPLNMNRLQVANGLIGAQAKHPILKYCIDNVQSRQQFLYLDSIPGLYRGSSIVAATGPALLTKAIFFKAGKGQSRDIVLPASYFYALRMQMLKYAATHDDFPPRFFNDLPPSFKTPLQAFATHYWEMRWKDPKPQK